MELLTDTVTKLEARLTRVRVVPDSINNTEENYASSSRGNMPESNEAKSAPTTDESNASIITQVSADTSKPFIPTHIVEASLNLRPTATISSRPITTLEVGTEVQYISQSDGCYYVNTRLPVSTAADSIIDLGQLIGAAPAFTHSLLEFLAICVAGTEC